jgi:hypothetical protein
MGDRRLLATDLGLRLAGVGSLAAARLSFHGLRGLSGAGGFHHAPPLMAFVLALVVFFAASIGTALVALGHHVFDRVEVASRWRRIDADRSRVR